MDIKNIFLMIFVFGLVVVISISCAPDLVDRNSEGKLLPIGIKKFKDGEISCWVYKDKGISCVKTG